ncbi:MAG: carboxypeptidase-like regulatory domain-containing protein, partial [Candidatus Diapherotrites archaeon]|nr:carboxypeptidase-like regulatory domain-containing protein [Candidatus Diapherotrites archaeon]
MPLDIKQFFSNIGQGIKNFYYGLEDKYYDFVDWLKDHGVPLYKFTDFVDQFAPSFVVLSLIFLLLIFLGLWFFLGTSITGTTTELTATLIVLDPVNNPVQDAQVQVFLPDKTETLTTNVSGKVRFILSAEQVSARVKIEKQDFTTFDSSIDFVAGLENTINLGLITGGLAEFQGTQYTVTVTNSETGRKISGISIEGSFNCSNPAVADPLPQRTTPLANSQPTFTFSVPENCNTLTGTILASGFTQDTKQIGNQNFIFSLTPEAVQAVTGTLDVQVLDSNSRDVNNAIVRVFNSDNQVVKEGISDSHGSARLTEIPAGTYKVTATKAGQSKTNDSVEIQAGRTTAITLQFARAVSGQKLFFKIIDSNTSQNLVEAIVLIYKNSDWVSDILTTDNSGTISFALTDAVDSNTTFTALVSEEGYKTQLFRLTVQLASSTVPQTFQLVPVDPDCSGNCGNILVTVQDSEQVVQNQAQVNIYRVEFSNIPINSNPLSFFDTNTDGQVLFQGMADGTYYAKATKTEKLGQSPTRLLANGLDIELPVTIILGNGFVEVTVKQKDSDQPVVADVNFVSNFNGALLGSCRTQALDGKCTSQSIPANEFVWVQVSAEGFFPVEIGDNGRAIDIIPVTPKRIEVELTSLANIPAGEKIRLELDKICAFSPSWDCSSNTLLNSNASRDTPYLAVFNLQFLEPAVNPVFHLHIGSDLLQTLYEQGTVPPLGYKIKIEEVRAPQSVVQLYTCFKPVNDSFFTQDSSIVDCATTAAQANAKQAILSWPLVNVGERKVFAKIWIEKAQARGSSVELHAQTKGDFSGTEFLSPRLDIIRLLGEARCSPGQDVLWQFGFQAPFQGILFNPVERIGPDGLTQITVLQASESLTTSQDYSLNYQFSNCSNRTLQNVDLRIKATNVGLNDILLEQDLVFNAEPNGIPAPDGRIVSIPSLIRDSSFGPENISLFAPTKTAASTGFQFALLQAGQANIDDGVQHLRFVVQGGNQFAFEGIPEYIIANTEQTLEGVVKDYETLLPLENVIVEYRPYPGRAWSSSVHSFSTRTNAEGHYSIPLTRNNGLIIQVGDSARLMFTKPNYVEAKFWPEAQTLAGFSGIQCLIAPDLIHVSRISRETIIIQNNCSALKYKFSTDDSANLTLSQMPGSSTIAQGQEYDLASNQSLQIRIRSSSNSRFGIHPLYLMVQQSGEDTFTVGKII